MKVEQGFCWMKSGSMSRSRVNASISTGVRLLQVLMGAGAQALVRLTRMIIPKKAVWIRRCMHPSLLTRLKEDNQKQNDLLSCHCSSLIGFYFSSKGSF